MQLISIANKLKLYYLNSTYIGFFMFIDSSILLIDKQSESQLNLSKITINYSLVFHVNNR